MNLGVKCILRFQIKIPIIVKTNISEREEREEIIRDNRVARLLWFGLGFVFSFIIFQMIQVK
jgi:hypothetical protein